MGFISLVYSVISFLVEIWVFILFTGQVYFDIIYKFIFPPEPKNLDGEIILVRRILFCCTSGWLDFCLSVFLMN